MIVGISLVRNEVDIIASCVRHHFINEGFDRIIVADDGSDDGTFEALLSLNDGRLIVQRRQGAFRQADIVSVLAKQAFAMGATWVVPFDADEFWHAPGGLSAYLADCNGADAFMVQVENFVQNESVHTALACRLHGVKYRTKTFGGMVQARELVESGACSYVEAAYPPKFIHRATASLTILAGNHGTDHPSFCETADVRCLHLPLRAYSIYNSKIAHSQRLDEEKFPTSHGWHLRYFAATAKSEGLEREWRANSEKRGYLNARRGKIALIRDPTLSQLVVNLDAASRRQLPRFSWAAFRAALRRLRLFRASAPKPDHAPKLHQN